MLISNMKQKHQSTDRRDEVQYTHWSCGKNILKEEEEANQCSQTVNIFSHLAASSRHRKKVQMFQMELKVSHKNNRV